MGTENAKNQTLGVMHNMTRSSSMVRNSRVSVMGPMDPLKRSVSSLVTPGVAKMDHIYNGNYYQWEMLVSPRTSLQYIKHIILRYDPLLGSMQSDEAEYKMDESKLRF